MPNLPMFEMPEDNRFMQVGEQDEQKVTCNVTVMVVLHRADKHTETLVTELKCTQTDVL